VDDAVAGLDGGGHDVGIVDLGAAVQVKGNIFALQRGGGEAVAQVARHDLAGYNVVEQDLLERAFGVGQQAVHRAGGQLGERGVGRCEDREGAFPFQRIHQPGSLYGGDEGGEVAGGHGGVNDIGRLVLGQGSRGQQPDDQSQDEQKAQRGVQVLAHDLSFVRVSL